MKEFKIYLPRKKYGVETVRYAAYTLCGRAYVLLEREGSRLKAVIRPKNHGLSTENLEKDFLKALEEEKFSQQLFKDNRELYFWMIMNAVNYGKKGAAQGISSLSPGSGRGHGCSRRAGGG